MIRFNKTALKPIALAFFPSFALAVGTQNIPHAAPIYRQAARSPWTRGMGGTGPTRSWRLGLHHTPRSCPWPPFHLSYEIVDTHVTKSLRGPPRLVEEPVPPLRFSAKMNYHRCCARPRRLPQPRAASGRAVGAGPPQPGPGASGSSCWTPTAFSYPPR